MNIAQVGAAEAARVVPQPAIVAWAFLFVAALALTGVYDEAISQRYANPTRSWAQLFEKYGEIPGYVTSAVGAAIVLATNNPKLAEGGYDRKMLGMNAACFGWLCVRFTAVVYKASQLLPDQLSKPVAGAIGVGIIGCVCSPVDVRVHTNTSCSGAG